MIGHYQVHKFIYINRVTDILNDAEVKFESGENYTFEAKANYHGNRDLVSQITFDKKSLTPAEVYVVDSERTSYFNEILFI